MEDVCQCEYIGYIGMNSWKGWPPGTPPPQKVHSSNRQGETQRPAFKWTDPKYLALL